MGLKRFLPATLKSRLGQLARRAAIYARWLRDDVPADPRFELYARRQGWANRRAFQADAAQSPADARCRAAAFGGHEVPRIIWMYWQQGEADAPFVVRRCIESWRRHNPDWELRVLDATTVADFADMSDCPKVLPARFFADMLRLRLLKAHGGVWADATVYCHRPLEQWIGLQLLSGFFAFRHPGPSRWVASWFLMSEPDHILPRIWEAGFAPYMRRRRYVPDMYFVFFYMFQWQLRQDPQAMAAWRRGAGLPAPPAFFMMQALEGRLDPEQAEAVVAEGFPVSKLSWKTHVSEADFDAFCQKLEQLGNSAS